MIPRPLSEIAWGDIEALIELNRAEDDRIEFKSSFKGNDDYAALNDSQRQQVLDSLAREVIAFLNTRGGDLIVGIDESEGPSPSAAGIQPIKNPADAADRVARGLAAIIEPAQTNISVRGLSRENAEGVLIVRVEPSIRAPHRSKRTRDCYARRGSESVPMAMDEIQDLTINRTRLRMEQLEFLNHQFADFHLGKSEHRELGDEVIHVRTVVVPLLDQSFTIDDRLLNAFGNRNPTLYDSTQGTTQNDVAFRNLHSGWQPVLRGRKQEEFREYGGDVFRDFQYARKVVKESGVCIFDYAVDSHFDGDLASVHADWLVGYFAQITDNLERLSKVHPSAFPCTLRVGLRIKGNVRLGYGSRMWAERKELPQGTFFFPDFALSSPGDLNSFFQQAQVDLYSLINVSKDDPYSLVAPSAGTANSQASGS
jgi:hypothetical protein